VYIIYYVIVVIASILLIRATKRRDHNNMMMFMILMAIGVIMSFIHLIGTGWAGFGFSLLMAGLDLYFFICIYSLYDLFRNERLGNNNQVQMTTTQTVVFAQPQQVQGYPIQSQPYQYQPQVVGYAQPPVYEAQQPQVVVQSSAPLPSNDDQNQQKMTVY
jgi:hypothetical protein